MEMPFDAREIVGNILVQGAYKFIGSVRLDLEVLFKRYFGELVFANFKSVYGQIIDGLCALCEILLSEWAFKCFLAFGGISDELIVMLELKHGKLIEQIAKFVEGGFVGYFPFVYSCVHLGHSEVANEVA